jgi:hypothetical protein
MLPGFEVGVVGCEDGCGRGVDASDREEVGVEAVAGVIDDDVGAAEAAAAGDEVDVRREEDVCGVDGEGVVWFFACCSHKKEPFRCGE